MATAFTWLHLTDLHVGQPRHHHNPDQILSMLLQDLEDLRADPGVPLPDVVFFTGDLAFSGAPAQYDRLEAFLGRLFRWLADHGKTTTRLAPVPGNHDLVWQRLDRDQRVLWRSFHDDADGAAREQLFESRRACLAAAQPAAARAEPRYWLDEQLERAFSGYTSWLARTKIPLLGGRTAGLLPGEYAATWEGEGGLRIGVLGLNSAYYDFPEVRPRPGEGMLALYPEQLDALAGPDDFDTWCAARHVNIALSHHPPAWLAGAGTSHLRERYFTGGRVALHLCGHVHEKGEAQWGRGWSAETRVFLGRSLFGIEAFEGAGQKAGPRKPTESDLSRTFGYALGQLRFTPGSETAELCVYPRRADLEETMKLRPDAGTGNRTKALETQRVAVRPLPAAPSVPPSVAPASVQTFVDAPASSAPTVFRRPIYGEILHELLASKPLRPGGVFLFAPTRYGATTFADFVEAEVGARRADPGEARAVILVRFDFQSYVENGLAAGAIEKRLCAALCHKAFARAEERAEAPTETLTECVEHVIGKMTERTLILLVLESFRLLPASDNGSMQARIRAAIDPHKYTPSSKGGLRVLVVGKAPSARTFSKSAPGSLLPPALSAFSFGPLSEVEAVRYALRHPAWGQQADNLRWLWRHTGGHPEVYFRLCDAFARVGGALGSLTLRPATDAGRAAWLHGDACPLRRDVDELAETLATTLDHYAKHLPAPWGALPAGGPPDEEHAVARCGLFLSQTPPLAIIPFVDRVIARRAGS